MTQVVPYNKHFQQVNIFEIKDRDLKFPVARRWAGNIFSVFPDQFSVILCKVH